MLSGVFFTAVATIGVFKMPDVYTKQHALGLIDTMGVPLIAISVMLNIGFTLASLKVLLLTIVVVLISAPACYSFMQALVVKNNLVSKALQDINTETSNPNE